MSKKSFWKRPALSSRLIISPRSSLNSSSQDKLKEPKRAFTLRSRLSVSPTSGITIVQLRQLFEARCHDLNISVLSPQEQRFINVSGLHFQNRKIILRDMNLGLASAKVLGRILADNFDFYSLNLSCNSLGNEGASHISQKLSQNSSILHLDISSNNIAAEGTAKVFKYLKAHSSLVSIDIHSFDGLHRNQIGIPGSLALQELLKENKILTHLNLEGTNITNKAISNIANGLASNKSILSLNLSKNHISNVEDLCEALLDSKIQKLDLSHNMIDCFGSECLSGVLNQLVPIQSLNLSYNKISASGLTHLFYGVHQNYNIEELKLDFNILTEAVSFECGHWLASNNSIKLLSMVGCKLNDRDILHLSEDLEINRSLLTLNVSKNCITDFGISMLTEHLMYNTFLKSLVLDEIDIKIEGVKCFKKLIAVNKTLSSISLKDNNLSEDIIDIFIELARKNSSLISINLENNGLSLKKMYQLSHYLKTNSKNKHKDMVPKLKEKIDWLAKDLGKTERIHQESSEVDNLKKRLNENISKSQRILKNNKLSQSEKNCNLKVKFNSNKEAMQRLNTELKKIEEKKVLYTNRLSIGCKIMENKIRGADRNIAALTACKNKINADIRSKKVNKEIFLRLSGNLKTQEVLLKIAKDKRDDALADLKAIQATVVDTFAKKPKKKVRKK